MEDMPRLTRHLEMIVDAMDGLDHVSTCRSTPPAEEGYPILEIRIDERKLGRSAFDAAFAECLWEYSRTNQCLCREPSNILFQ